MEAILRTATDGRTLDDRVVLGRRRKERCGSNRFLLAMLNYTKYQQLETVKLHNKAILKEGVFEA